ncbi:MAG: acyl carrier protein [Rhodothermia bacterium]|nr:acyl carrier protein [Rhodothermia bacterium]
MSIYRELEKIFETVISDGPVELTAETQSADVPGWDSVAHINLMVSIEQAFGVTFASAEMASFQRVGDLVECLERKGVSVSN